MPPGAARGHFGDGPRDVVFEQALSIDNIFVMSLLFHSFRVPVKYQHRILFWGILGAIVFRVSVWSGPPFTE